VSVAVGNIANTTRERFGLEEVHFRYFSSPFAFSSMVHRTRISSRKFARSSWRENIKL